MTVLALVAAVQAMAQSADLKTQIPAGQFYFVMDKERNELSVRSLVEAGKVFRTYRAISGSNPGDKIKEGDKKTPEGIYFIESRIPQRQLHALHGAAAFELNYPNPVDRILGRTGYGIWLHGVDDEARLERRFDTRGCVATSNDDIRSISEFLSFRNVPFVIVDREDPATPIGISPAGSALRDRVYAWARAWSSKDLEAYMSFYAPEFRSRNMDWAAWKNFKARLKRNYEFIDVTVKDLKILNHGKYSVAIFDQTYVSDRYQSRSLKRLYLVGSGADAQILAEEVAEEKPEAQIDFSLGSL